MAIVSIENLLDRASEFERRLEDYYSSIRDQSKNNGVRLLTYYLSRHRRHLEQATENFEPGVLARVKSVKLKFDIDFDPEKELELMDTEPDKVKGEELLDYAVKYDLTLVSLYKKILEQPLGADATALVESLIRVEEKDVVMLKKMLATHYF